MTALNFPDSPSNGDTYQGYTYNSTKGTWAKPAEQDARTAVYANIAALPTSGTAGDMAYVTATNRLYIWTGTGWYNIALINTNPTISGVSSSYALAIDGTATTVTITASDPEGLPITYSIVSDTSGNSATVAQGTGSNTNVFTVTPSTNTAHAGTFSLTFRASDGVNIASSAASFTLQFKVVNQNYTTALITSVGTNNAVNNSFDDKSTNDHTITAAGNATQNTFSPYRHGGYSTYFDGSGDYLQPAGTTIFDISSSTASFTVEAWINPPALPSAGAYNYRFGSIISKAVVYVSFGFTNNGTLRFYTYNGAQNYINSAAGAIETGKWQHVALVSDAGSITIYKDGVSVATGTLVAPASAGIGVAPKIATADTGQAADYINSYVTDLRVVDGTAVYTSAFTPPTERLTAITNTSLLTCHLPYIADGSTNGHAITVTGNTSTRPFAPYDAQEYSASSHGGSMYFDGSGDTLTIPGDASYQFGTGDFTIEFWWYPRSATNPQYILMQNFNDANNGYSNWLFYVASASSLVLYSSSTGSSWNVHSGLSIGSYILNQWNHVAITRESGSLKTFINGTLNTTVSNTADYSNSGGVRISSYNGTNDPAVQASISNLRLVKGTAVYTSAFTPPTAPLTAISGTSLLLKGTDAGIIDKAQTPRFVKLLGNTKSSTTQTKFLSSSMYFDGTGDYIEADDQDIGNFGSGDFTAEGWFYLTASPSNYITIAETRGSGGSTTGWVMAISAGDFYVYSGALIGAKGSAISSNTWYHWAFTRSGTDQKVFLNGTQTGSTYTTARNYTDNNFTIGAKHDASEFFTGYQSDVRITKGLARYTANFTPPTAALKG
jgi:hypothetical protein